MSLVLTPQLETLIRQNVDSGRYGSASEVVQEALRVLEERDRPHQLRASLAYADEQVDRGEGVDWTPELMERLKREASENARAGKPIF